ncbi:mannan endo-1,4-beta-mannosidase [Synchytrium microbalum]|uniref:Mannan endo-1,4-beta-mannosidase n=1 Tax=Synchytrium microbalum TaxID=1806994 RepID=A0A507C1Z8_9FUNG|nr:mannan endo-1,4-beta-mannosidase [Synchytrium microbalum]TPX35147.1 mannan endo-1,4-beta-mannosidase [Synchytrium microbalum]
MAKAKYPPLIHFQTVSTFLIRLLLVSSLLTTTVVGLGLFEPAGAPYLCVRPDVRAVGSGYADTPASTNSRLGFNAGVYHFSQNLPNTNSPLFPIGGQLIAPTGLLDDTATDAILMLTLYPMRPGSADGISDLTDAMISDLANQLAALNKSGRRVIVRLAAEMNGNWRVWGQKPTAFIPFWKKVVTAVRAVAPQTAFLWSPNVRGTTAWTPAAAAGTPDFIAMDTNGDGAVNALDDPYTPFYPGDEWVDWVGLENFYFGLSTTTPANVLPPAGFFQASIRGFGPGTSSFDFYTMFAVNHNKPFACSECPAVFYGPGPYVGATGVANGAGELPIKQNWWRQTITNASVLSVFPRLKLWGMFEYAVIEDGVFKNDQVLNASNPTGTLSAFLADLKSSSISFTNANATAGHTTSTAWATSTPATGSSSSGVARRVWLNSCWSGFVVLPVLVLLHYLYSGL